MRLMDSTRSFLLVVDVQEKLIPAVHEHDELVANLVRLLGVATELGVPVRASEQYPQGLGQIIAPLREYIPEAASAEKTHFSCAQAPSCRQLFTELERTPQVIVAGVEAQAACAARSAVPASRAILPPCDHRFAPVHRPDAITRSPHPFRYQ